MHESHIEIHISRHLMFTFEIVIIRKGYPLDKRLWQAQNGSFSVTWISVWRRPSSNLKSEIPHILHIDQ